MIRGADRRLGEILMARGALAPARLEEALAEQGASPTERLGDILVRTGACGEREVLEAVAEQLAVPFVLLDRRFADPDVLEVVPRALRERHGVLPMFLVDGDLTVAMAEPSNVFAIEEVRRATGARVHAVLASSAALRGMLSDSGGKEDAFGIADIVESIERVDPADLAAGAAAAAAGATAGPSGDLDDLEEVSNLPAVVRVVNYIIYKGIKDKASDIHVEPYEDVMRVRYRVDGILHEVLRPPLAMQHALISRLKIMASLDIGERRMPQDGRIKVMLEGRRIDLRVSVLPTLFGEKVVLRILDRKSTVLKLDSLGFDPALLERFRKLIERPHGVILVTGPTGSGKTTTLYSALQELNDQTVNISTIEDPVEYNLSSINQVQTHARIGLKFSTVLRSMLRQDPDVIMVGEIRDQETAEMAIQAALTGHLVFSTLHTNDAPGAVTRLINMGVEPYLVSSALTAVLAQRLVRKICPRCRRRREPTAVERRLLLEEGFDIAEAWEGAGCVECRDAGFSGRAGVHELLVPDDEMRDMISRNPTLAELRRHAVDKLRMRSLRSDGLAKAAVGSTTIEEILRITAED